MKINLLLPIALLPSLLFGQGGWTRITDSNNPIVTFTSPGFYKGAAWVDVNNDGWVDLFAVPNFLFINQGGTGFVQSTDSVILPTPLQNPGGCSWGDVDNDGDLDLLLAQHPSRFYLNDGTGHFTDLSASLPTLSGYASWGCAMADVNNDSRLDLLFAHANGFHGTTPTPCKFYLQGSSPLTFTQITGHHFTDNLEPYTVPYFHDYDLDGDMDLFIASGPGGSPGPDFHYKNLKVETGNDTLTRMTTEPWATQNQDGQCYNFVDPDNDRDFDLCLTNYGGAASRYYTNLGGVWQLTQQPFTTTGQFLSNAWGDYDNDGDLDVIITADNVITRYYRNDAGSFTFVSNGFSTPAGATGITAGDYDNDGDLDLFVHGLNTSKALYRNDSVATGNHWVNLRLVGTASNRAAIGAILWLRATVNGQAVWQMRQLNAQNTFQGHHDLRQHFGLGDAEMIDSLVVRWSSGLREQFPGRSINAHHTLTEGDGMAIGLADPQPAIPFQILPNPSDGQLQVSIGQPISGTLVIQSLDGKLIETLAFDQQAGTFQLQHLAAGTYFVTLKTQFGQQTQRWVRQ